MRLDDFTWVAAPPPPRHRVARGVAWLVFWLTVLVAAVALGWGLAEGIVDGRFVVR
jgi:hypothetical protein